MFEKNWKKEFARDTLALGGLAFYFIVIGRALIGSYMEFVWQIVVAAIFILVSSLIFKKADYHIARGLILVIFTIIFYNETRFAVFALILLGVMLACSLYTWRDKKKTIYGLILGAIISLLSYYLVNWFGIS